MRNVTRVFVLAIALALITLPNVRAQSTSITNLQTPSSAFVGTQVTVTVAATYNLGSNGYALSVGIFDLDAYYTTGTAKSSQYTCHAPQPSIGFCGYVPNSTSGADVVTFELTFSSVKTYRLRAAVVLYYSNGTLISSASTFQEFSIAVSATTSQSLTSQLQSTTQAYPTYSNTTVLTSQTPQPTRSSVLSQSTNNTPQLALVIGVVATVAVTLGGLFLRSRRSKQPKTGI